jgi:hypothetical protein
MKNLTFVILILAIFALACRSSNSGAGNSSIFPVLGFDDETEEASGLVGKANEDLREIRKIQKANSGKLEELQASMRERDSARTKQIFDELISAISDGLSLGETAFARVEEASEKKTNDKFNEYLRLKKEALRKQIDAFEFRLKVAKDLREKLGTTDAAAMEKAKADFARNEENFKQLWDAAEDLNERANRLARENPGKIKAK